VSARTFPMTVEHSTPVIPDPSPDMRSALIGLDDELRRLHGAPHNVDDHGLAHAWVVARAALWPAGSRAGGGR